MNFGPFIDNFVFDLQQLNKKCKVKYNSPSVAVIVSPLKAKPFSKVIPDDRDYGCFLLRPTRKVLCFISIFYPVFSFAMRWSLNFCSISYSFLFTTIFIL